MRRPALSLSVSVDLAAHTQLPAISYVGSFVEAGGLMPYLGLSMTGQITHQERKARSAQAWDSGASVEAAGGGVNGNA
jgi:hypothetical protein